jgi:hypothetical protein
MDRNYWTKMQSFVIGLMVPVRKSLPALEVRDLCSIHRINVEAELNITKAIDPQRS